MTEERNEDFNNVNYELFISDDDGASEIEGTTVFPNDSTAILEEIREIRLEQEKVYAEFNQKLELLFARLEETK